MKQLDNGAYVIEPADGHGSTRVVNRAELQVCPPSVPQRSPERTTRQRVSRGPQQADSSDDDSYILVLQLTLYHHNVLQQNLILMSQAVMETLTGVLQMIQELTMNCLCGL